MPVRVTWYEVTIEKSCPNSSPDTLTYVVNQTVVEQIKEDLGDQWLAFKDENDVFHAFKRRLIRSVHIKER